jgi:hypothetical protein
VFVVDKLNCYSGVAVGTIARRIADMARPDQTRSKLKTSQKETKPEK